MAEFVRAEYILHRLPEKMKKWEMEVFAKIGKRVVEKKG